MGLTCAAFGLGIVLGVFLEWSAWTRCRRQHMAGTPSASHNRPQPAMCPVCNPGKWCTRGQPTDCAEGPCSEAFATGKQQA